MAIDLRRWSKAEKEKIQSDSIKFQVGWLAEKELSKSLQRDKEKLQGELKSSKAFSDKLQSDLKNCRTTSDKYLIELQSVSNLSKRLQTEKERLIQNMQNMQNTLTLQTMQNPIHLPRK